MSSFALKFQFYRYHSVTGLFGLSGVPLGATGLDVGLPGGWDSAQSDLAGTYAAFAVAADRPLAWRLADRLGRLLGLS